MVTHGRRMDYIGLNPFEVREVLQVSTSSTPSNAKRLNPFEVREVLQDFTHEVILSHPCLNPFEVREVLQVIAALLSITSLVSIPLKSGRCCKVYQTFLQLL